MEKKGLLLVIDLQNDFVDQRGSLFVKKGDQVVKNLTSWMRDNKGKFSKVIATQDYHPEEHIGFSSYWETEIPPFTKIRSAEVQRGECKPKDKRKTLEITKYLHRVESIQGNPLHTIWPNHCIAGTWGAELSKEFVLECGDKLEVYQKGVNPDKEMYSALTYSDGTLDTGSAKLLKDLEGYDKIYVAGVAKDYCVAKTVEDLIGLGGLSEELVILECCMAAIDDSNETLKVFDNLWKE